MENADLLILITTGAAFLGYVLLLLFGAMPEVRSQARELGLEAGWGFGVDDAHAGEKWDYDPTGEYTYKHQNPAYAHDSDQTG